MRPPGGELGVGSGRRDVDAVERGSEQLADRRERDAVPEVPIGEGAQRSPEVRLHLNDANSEVGRHRLHAGSRSTPTLLAVRGMSKPWTKMTSVISSRCLMRL